MSYRNGGPVFPFEYHNQTRIAQPGFFGTGDLAPGASQQFAGMSLRDYFAAHAPAEPQKWFNPKMRPCPVVPSHHAVPEGDLRTNLLRFYVEDWNLEDVSAEAQAWVEAKSDASEAQDAWQAEFRVQTYLQWPYAWADAMLEQRKC